MKQDALETVIFRNAFYRDNYRRALFALFLLLLLNICLVAMIVYRAANPPQPQYFAATPDGRLINVHPLSDPVVSNSFVLQWSASTITKVYSIDFLHWRAQLQEASNRFTPDGWKMYLAQLKQSNNLRTIMAYKLVATAEVTGSPVITQQAVISGHYVWKVEVPVYVTYTSGLKTIHQTAKVTMLVVRMPVAQDPDRIAVNNFIVNERAA